MPSGKSKAQPTLLRKLNERKVLEVIQDRGPISRADVCRLSGISAPTVSKTVAILLEAHLVEEIDIQPTSPGRPSKLLRLASESVQVVGVVVGTRRCWVLTAGLDGKLDETHMFQFATPGSYEGIVEEVVSRVAELHEKRKLPILGVGISIPGLLNRRESRTVFSPNLHQTDGQQLGLDLQRRLEVETVLLQEAYALSLAERTYGQARGLRDFAMLDASEGLGLGVFSGGQYIDGHSGLGCELGHITVDPRGRLCGCGNHGCLETVATDAALARALVGREVDTVEVDEILALFQAGQLASTADFQLSLEYLAIGVSAVMNLFNPTQVFIYNRFLSAESWLFRQVADLARRRALRPIADDCELKLAKGSKRQGAIAGIIHHLTTARGPALESP